MELADDYADIRKNKKKPELLSNTSNVNKKIRHKDKMLLEITAPSQPQLFLGFIIKHGIIKLIRLKVR